MKNKNYEAPKRLALAMALLMTVMVLPSQIVWGFG